MVLCDSDSYLQHYDYDYDDHHDDNHDNNYDNNHNNNHDDNNNSRSKGGGAKAFFLINIIKTNHCYS